MHVSRRLAGASVVRLKPILSSFTAIRIRGPEPREYHNTRKPWDILRGSYRSRSKTPSRKTFQFDPKGEKVARLLVSLRILTVGVGVSRMAIRLSS